MLRYINPKLQSLYQVSKSLPFYLFNMREIIVAVTYVAVEVIHFLVVAKRDVKSVTIPDETGKAR